MLRLSWSGGEREEGWAAIVGGGSDGDIIIITVM